MNQELIRFNNKYFPTPDFKYWIRDGKINEYEYGHQKEKDFLTVYNSLVKKFNIELNQHNSNSFLNKWYSRHIRSEIDLVFNEIKKIKNISTKKIATIILSRTIRSCRATTHYDLATLKSQ